MGGLEAHVVMPSTAPDVKKAAVQGYGNDGDSDGDGDGDGDHNEGSDSSSSSKVPISRIVSQPCKLVKIHWPR